MTYCKIIALEGADQVGKFTQSHLLLDELKRRGKKAVIVEVPIIKNKLSYSLIYWMLQNGIAKKVPTIFQAFQFLLIVWRPSFLPARDPISCVRSGLINR